MNRVAKNMDSVFANCTASELDFEVMFDDDDSLIDLVAGVNEMGELITGPNPEDTYEYQLDEDGNDPLTDKDDEKQREGTAKSTEGSHEGTVRDADEKFESPEGMKSEIPGSSNSAEHTSHEDDAKDAEQKALTHESADSDGPLKDDDEAAREGKAKESTCPGCGNTVGKCVCGKAIKESIVEKILASYNESDNIDTSMNNDSSQAEMDNRKLEQDMKRMEQQSNNSSGSNNSALNNSLKESIVAKILEANVESRTDDTFEAELRKEGNKEDNLSDKDDEDLRDGKVKYDSNYKEAIKQKIIGAAQEAAEECGDTSITAKADQSDTIPDSVQTNSASNNIVPDVETQSSDGLAPATEEVEYIRNKILENLGYTVEAEVEEGVESSDEVDYIRNKILENYSSEDDNEPVVYKGWLNNVHEATGVDAVTDDEEDADIEAIANGKAVEDELDLNVDYDDDELIDMAIQGKI